MSTTSPNMSLVVSTIAVDSGLAWETNLNASLGILDSHNHTPGQGVQIPPSGLNINSDLTFQSNNAINLRTTRYIAQSAALAGASDLNCVYTIGKELYYNDGLGNHVQLTNNGSIAAAAGNISNLTSPASASYVSLSSTFVWQSAANTPANMDAASYIFRNLTANSKGLALNPPASMAADSSLTLPSLPASQKIMTLDASGSMSAPYSVDNSTIEISANIIQVKALGISTAQIAAGAVTAAKVETSINLPGSAVQENGKNVIVSNTNTTRSLAIIRGHFNSSGTLLVGEGLSATRTGAGLYTLSWTTAFGDSPIITATIDGSVGGAITPNIALASTTGANLAFYNTSGTLADTGFHIIAIAERA